MKQSYFTSPGFTFRLQPFGATTALFLIFFLLNFSFGFGQGPENTTPDYNHENDEDIGSATIADTDEIIIAIATDSDGFIYTLSFGSGVEKLNPDGTIAEANFISENELDAPLDIEINSRGEIHITDYFESGSCGDNGKIKVFNTEGNLLSDRTILTGFYRPLGIAINSDDQIYVAEYNPEGPGCENEEKSRINIYKSDGSVINTTTNVHAPYRLAVDSNNFIYISHDNNGNSEVAVFDDNLIKQNSLAVVESPGSIEIDKYGFIHVVDYVGRLEFGQFLNLEDLAPLQLLPIVVGVLDGIEEQDFIIQIFDSNREYRDFFRDDEVDFPVDIVTSNMTCEQNFFINNSNIFINSIFPIDINFDFDIEVYNRIPSYDTENPIAVCENGLELTLANGEVTISAEEIDGGSTDNCEIADLELSRYTFDEARDYDIELIVTDAAGNTDTCSTSITILPGEEETPPEATCNSFEVVLDNNGEASITAGEVYDGEEDLELKIDKSIFTCEDIGENEVTLTATDPDTELTGTCTALITVRDDQNPGVNCIDPGEEFQLENGSVTIAVSDIELNSSDNCGIVSRSLSQTTFTTSGTKTITLTVEDEAGNTAICNTTIEILPEESAPFNFQCVEEYKIRLGEDDQISGVTEIPTSEFVTSDISKLDFEITNQQFTCDDIGTNSRTINATHRETGEQYSCSVSFTVVDEGAPLIICPAEPITTNLPEGGYAVPNFFENRVSDNCDNIEDLELVQDIAAGTILDSAETYTINLTATDSNDNEETCQITIILEENDPNAPEIDCVNHELFLDENGQATLDPEDIFAGELGNLELSTDIENFDCSNLGENTVILTATDPDTGLSDTCVTEVLVLDDIAPEANCVAPGREFRLENGSVTISASAIDLNSEDNCDITRTLSVDTFTTPGIKNIILNVEDTAGNTDECSTTIEILPEDTDRVYRCIEEEDIPNIRLDEDCELNIPDYTRLIETEHFNPAITQTYEELTEETYLITVEIRDADTDEFVGECEFSVGIVDLIPPTISCPNDQLESFDPDTGFEVPNYENMAGISDNCGEVSFRQEPAAGEIIYNNTTVNLFVEDEGGLDASCTFELELTESDVLNITCQIDKNVSPDDNCSFWLPDYTGTAEVNFPGAEITQTPPAGTILTESTQIQLTASLDGETDDCYFMVNLVDDEAPVANCVSGYVVNLDNNGTATINPEDLDDNSTDNCGIVSMALSQTEFTTTDIGDVPVTLTVRDDAGNIDSCETTVEVRGEASGEFECRENIEVFLDENGQANLNLQDLYTGDASEINLEASQLNFTCEDVGTAIIQLDYSGDETGSCMIKVDVRDELPPEINTNLVELTLNPEGFAYLEETDILAEDNCSEELIYRFSKSVFTCKYVGMNSINVEVEDVNGNRTDQNIQVRISGESCDFPESGGNEYLFLYPNPNNGIFTIATPEGMFIEQVKVFDSRGRYIMQQEYNANARFYRMTIQGVEESVYTLQIFTNEGVLVKRAIIKR
ncbi:hypothetical protein APR41_14695 [Salegentibacter salinarum]|uniref:HYR domain-containing protein n=1 Tax=Salegentibacter salinarum TaxID=447422 RepID=A0A2N0TZR4_9FLAO|nr:HYR domain-containing protein [Salegentibacter salinarum]PKD20227.1 hypothetical protein APR41_14695 [Salegentibacter salinarum]SKB87612.1 Por secretion system C-terminal sorting domain-containing protein [Salegentibacter salinarum]